eukprot:TRINITY_DN2866_c0_g1_i1.p1 TRINITY_DN2866_c0_g1~~TRINITY_DN2866_c0_g1_i1.p1  ORF type:complete len:169 (-),score=31.38 TRINITY_DN2866_c0_g1_i1:90-596(-)
MLKMSTSGAAFLVDEKIKWGAEVPYKISPLLKDEQKVVITQALNEFNTLFPGTIKCVAYYNDSDYVHFLPGQELSSSVGKQGGEQFITVPQNSTKNDILRQLVSAVGHQCDKLPGDQGLQQKDLDTVSFIYKKEPGVSNTTLILAHAAGVVVIAGFIYIIWRSQRSSS